MLQNKVYERPQKQTYIDKFFCWIESGDIASIKNFLETYSDIYPGKLITQNQWNAQMYACRFTFRNLNNYRYGNLELIEYLLSKGFKLESSTAYSLVHAACFGNELEVVKYLVEVKKQDVNPNNQYIEQTPLRFACKVGFYKIMEFLIKRGAYYCDDQNYCNGLKKVLNNENHVIKYVSLKDDSEIMSKQIYFLKDEEIQLKKLLKLIRYSGYLLVLNQINKPGEDSQEKIQIENLQRLVELSKSPKIRQTILNYL